MKYYWIEIQTTFPDEERVLGMASGKFLPPEDIQYLDSIRHGEIVEDAPVFDYYYLTGWSSRGGKCEWRLQDAHKGADKFPSGNWYISDKFKKLLEEFHIAPGYHFYPTKLLYKKNKLDYWIFQFPVPRGGNYQNFNLEKSAFYYEAFDGYKEFISVKNREELDSIPFPSYCPKVVLKDNYDLVCSIGHTKNIITYMHKIVSERLKVRIEEELTGFLFHEIDYEVEIDTNK